MEAPQSITMLSTSSWQRSLRGFFYSALQSWRYRKQQVLATTHLGFPGHKHQILTVHDVRPQLMPDSWVHVLYFRFMLPRALRRANGVLTVSETSRDAISQTYNIPREKIYVVPNVVRVVPPEAIPVPIKNEVPYLLMVNAAFRHKNAAEVLSRHALWEADYRLKILAGEGHYRDELRTQTRRLGLADRVDFLPQVSDEELASLYTHAAALVYPSLLEGFGLPPAEAMAYGTPVIVSDIPVFHELFADAPLFVRLGDTASWRRALEGIEEARRPERIEHARCIAGQYTDERMCSALTAALRSIWPPA
jgi:glycosyltransferase involved in cell wall biosynthesis